MLVNIDLKYLEWLCAVFLSKDKVGYDEINRGIDLHSSNQERLGLPSRLVAKVFLFRLIYGGSAYAYANDPDFTDVSRRESFWQSVIDRTYDKYTGLAQWHTAIVQEVSRTGYLRVPTGRVYEFFRERGELPRSKILNYPVQGLGHDLAAILRISLRNSLTAVKSNGILVCSVHDSVLLDVPKVEVPGIIYLINATLARIPKNFERLFGIPFDLPVRADISIGPDWGHLEEIIQRPGGLLTEVVTNDAN